jgi:exopolyphosphatase/guanosine-5'-triphosphate,3'-diphosphate pyrophosphatase
MSEADETAQACIALGRRCGFEEEHSRQDARLALRLFDQLSSLHDLDERHRDLLYFAALLHDIGYVEGYWGHHKTAYRLILGSDLPGVTACERRIVANVARYHRGARPKLKHEGFAALDPEDQEAVRQLGAILRLADGLDRGHVDAVQDLEVRWRGDDLVILVDCPLGCGAEVWAGEKKGRFLGEVLGVRVQVRERIEG